MQKKRYAKHALRLCDRVVAILIFVISCSATAFASTHFFDLRDNVEIRLVDEELSSDTGAQGAFTGLRYLPANSSQHGQCLDPDDARSMAVSSGGGSQLTLDFVERRSRVMRTVRVLGSKTVKQDGHTLRYRLDANVPLAADAEVRYSFALLPPGEFDEIPFGGVWEGELRMQMVRGADGHDEGVSWSRRFVLNVTDNDNIQIYRVSPIDGAVDLDLRPSGRDELIGHALIKTCLYDGFNANSSQYRLTITGDGPHGGDFKVYSRDDTASIAYHVHVGDPGGGGHREVSSGDVLTFDNTTEDSAVSTVISRLGSGPTQVYCTPWDITLSVSPFKQIDQQAGHYAGELSIFFSPAIGTTAL